MTLELRRPTEHEEQALLMTWATASAFMQDDHLKRIALLRLHSIPNGAAVARREDARRPGARQGGKLKAEGLKSSTPDLFLPFSLVRDGFTVYAGFYLEMKRYGEKPRQDQAACMEELRLLGYKAESFDLWQDAARAIVEYMDLTKYRHIEPALWLNLYLKAKAALKKK